MTDFARRYSKREIIAAGRALAGVLMYNEETFRAFRIAHDWREAHIRPMRRLRFELARATKKTESDAITAARLKRMQSIRRKLRRTPLTLYQIQDIGGCRAILHSMEELQNVLALYRDGFSKHTLRREDNYVEEPKPDGYRSCHMLMKFNGVGEDEIYNRQTIEIQLRTVIQHAWATAVEAVGLVRNEDLKGGLGDENWLRFFRVMGAEYANLEEGPCIPGVSEYAKERREEVCYLNDKLKIADKLEAWTTAIKFTDDLRGNLPRFFLI